MTKQMNLQQAVSKIRDGDTVLLAGFLGHGSPPDIIEEIIRQEKKDLSVVVNDAAFPEVGVGRLIYTRRLKKLLTSWCGATPLVAELSDSGELELELCPQGNLVERVRAGGFGLGGILTPTGLSTVVEERWGQRITLNGKDWLYQTPVRGNVAVLEAWKADEFGNLVFHHAQKNFSTVMAYAADLVIVSVVNPILKVGALSPDEIMVPGSVVDILIQQEVETK